MLKILTFLLPLVMVFAINTRADDNVIQTVQGKVVNEVTNEAVAFTNISIEGTFYGTASDEDGYFELKIPQELTSGQLHFSAVGYKRSTFPVTSLINRNYTIIKLEPQSYNIEDVDIAARSKVLMRILRMASENIPYNFLGGPFNLLSKYENKKITDDTITVSQSAEVVICDKSGYKNPSKLNAFRMRKYKITKPEPDYRFSESVINFDELLELDWVRSASSVLNPSILAGFKLSSTEKATFDNNQVWIISFSQSKPDLAGSGDYYASSFKGEITILKEDYSVKKFSGSVTAPQQNRQGRSLATGSSSADHYSDVSYDFEVTYSKLKPEIISLHKKYTYKGKKVKETSRLTIEKVEMSDPEKISTRDYFAN